MNPKRSFQDTSLPVRAMRVTALFITVVLLAAPGCTYLEESSDEESDNTAEVQSLIQGCTDPEACNYDEEANVDDGSCWYAEENCECDVDVIIDHCGVCGGAAGTGGAGAGSGETGRIVRRR